MKQCYPVSDCFGISKVYKEWEEKMVVQKSDSGLNTLIQGYAVDSSLFKKASHVMEYFIKPDVSCTIWIVDCTALASLRRTANSS